MHDLSLTPAETLRDCIWHHLQDCNEATLSGYSDDSIVKLHVNALS